MFTFFRLMSFYRRSGATRILAARRALANIRRAL